MLRRALCLFGLAEIGAGRYVSVQKWRAHTLRRFAQRV